MFVLQFQILFVRESSSNPVSAPIYIFIHVPPTSHATYFCANC